MCPNDTDNPNPPKELLQDSAVTVQSLALLPQAHGGALRPGGKKGNRGGGRHSSEYKLWLATLLRSQRHQREYIRIMEDGDHPAFMAATKHAADHGVGKPVEHIQVEDITIRVTTE